MSQPKTTSQKPKPPPGGGSAAPRNLSRWRYLPRSTPSMSLTATLTLSLPLLRTAVSAGCSGVGVVIGGLSRPRGLFACRQATAIGSLLGRRAAGDSHLAHRTGDGGDGLGHLRRPDRADAADAEGLLLRQLARIEDEAARLHRIVEGLEGVLRIGWRMEGQDDGRLDLGLQEWLEAEPLHARDERLAVRRVARQPRRLAALFHELAHRLGERRDHVGRRREAPLAGLFLS